MPDLRAGILGLPQAAMNDQLRIFVIFALIATTSFVFNMLETWQLLNLGGVREIKHTSSKKVEIEF